MPADQTVLKQAIQHGETDGGAVEFKERLSREVHLADGRMESLAAQLRHRVLSGDGEAMYVLGVTDDGGLAGIDRETFSETMDVLSLLAEEAGAHIESVDTWGIEPISKTENDYRLHGNEDGPTFEVEHQRSDDASTTRGAKGLVGVATIKEGAVFQRDDDHLVIGTAGHVDHGKSTLVGTLVTGESDDGEGGLRRFLDVQPHEIERGLSADLSYGVYGFGDDGPIRVNNPDRKDARAEVVRTADRVVSFVDTVGHEPWLSTTIRGLVGQKLDYGLLTVAVDDGPTETTREHLGVLLATELPTIVALTKVDRVAEERVHDVERTVERLLRDVGKTPLLIDRYGVDSAIDEISSDVVPIVSTSAVTREGLGTLDRLFERLPKTTDGSGSFNMYIDRTYSVAGVGPVASGTIQSGSVAAGDELLVGPLPGGSFRPVEVRSIEMHYHRVDEASAGRIVGIALKGIDEATLSRGMVLLPRSADPTPVRSFEAEVMVLNHPTKIDDGYEPVVHLETIAEAATFHPTGGQLLPGDQGKARIRFKFQPYLVKPGQRFVFREGKSKGVGTVTAVEPESD